MRIEAKQILVKNTIALGLYLLSFSQPKTVISEEWGPLLDYPPTPVQVIERPPLDPPKIKLPWECNVTAFECTEEHVQAAIVIAAKDHGVSQRLLECLSEAESHQNPYKISRTNDHGPFQFHENEPVPWRPYYWTMMDITPFADHSVYEPYGSAQATAWLIKSGRTTSDKGGWTTFGLCA